MNQNNQPSSFSKELPLLKHPVVMIIGPTASGKTDFSFTLAKMLSAEIINADSGQFYKPLSIGTAKPDLMQAPVPCHLFDILDQPIDLNVVQYRTQAFAVIDDIARRGKVSMLVGGSHFYLQSLFFPPLTPPEIKSDNRTFLESAEQSLWEQLQTIDPVRAQQLHPNDTYRIERALTIWRTTGLKPSDLAPQFKQAFSVLMVVINPPDEILKKRIKQRAALMLEDGGWLEEVRGLLGTEWEPFMSSQKLIGYDLLVAWLHGQQQGNLDQVCTLIQYETWQYAKRQKKFIRRFLELLRHEQTAGNFVGKIVELTGSIHDNDFETITSAYQQLLKR